MDYVTVDIIFSQAIPDLFTPGITTSTRCGCRFHTMKHTEHIIPNRHNIFPTTAPNLET